MPASLRARRAASRGFTLAELLMVLAVIGVLAAASMPTFVKLFAEKRVLSAANHIAHMYRNGKARSMGRGAAVIVRWDFNHMPPSAINPAGHFTVREAIQGSADDYAPMPTSRCLGAVDWRDASTTSKFVAVFDERWAQYSPAQAQFIDPSGTVRLYAELCFSPRGRTFVRYDAAGAFQPLVGVALIEVLNTDTNLVRRVIVPPTGAARVVTRI